MERAVKMISKDIEREVFDRIARIRNQLQAIGIALAETANQLTELTNSLSTLVSEVKALRREAKEIDRLRKEVEELRKKLKEGGGKK